MLQVSGIIAIPEDPKLNIVKPESSSGFFLNFQAVTQGKTHGSNTEFQYWNCMVWIPEQEKDKWVNDYIQSGNILYIEAGTAMSVPILDGKYHNTKIKLDFNKTKKLAKPIWIQE